MDELIWRGGLERQERVFWRGERGLNLNKGSAVLESIGNGEKLKIAPQLQKLEDALVEQMGAKIQAQNTRRRLLSKSLQKFVFSPIWNRTTSKQSLQNISFFYGNWLFN